MPSFASITQRLGDSLAAYQIGATEQENRLRSERLQSLLVASQLGAQGIDASPMADQLLSPSNSGFAPQFGAAAKAGLSKLEREKLIQDRTYNLQERGVNLQEKTLNETVRGNQVAEDQRWRGLDLQGQQISQTGALARENMNLQERIAGQNAAIAGFNADTSRQTAEQLAEYRKDYLNLIKEKNTTSNGMKEALHPKDFGALQQQVVSNYASILAPQYGGLKSDGKGGMLPPEGAIAHANSIYSAALDQFVRDKGKTVGDFWTAVEDIRNNKVLRPDGTLRPKFADQPLVEGGFTELDAWIKDNPRFATGNSRVYAEKKKQIADRVIANSDGKYTPDYIYEIFGVRK